MTRNGKNRVVWRWSAIAAAVLGYLVQANFIVCADEAPRPPNIVLILADDLGAAELGCYGHPKHRTPRLDSLAKSGIQFATCYATPLCHPTRFEIMTGQYACHNGVWQFAGRPGGPAADDPVEDIGANHLTFAEILKQKGYATALAGKWQLSGRVPTLIHDSGFDEYLIWAYKHNLPDGVEHQGGWENNNDKTARYWHPCLLRNGQYVPTGPDDYGPDHFTDFLIDFARRHRDQPFLLYYPMALIHAPWVSTPDNTRNERDRTVSNRERNLSANVEYVDKLVGRLIDGLQEMGLRENTVILFTGDNGTGGAGKGQPTELGARVPMIVNGPGRIRPAGMSMELIDHSDILPTLVEMAGASLPKDRPIDGRSMVGILRGEPVEGREWIFSYLGNHRILRDRRWLLEKNTMLEPGRFFDCKDRRDGVGYVDVTDSTDPEVVAARARFDKILAGLPAPIPDPDAPARRQRNRRRATRPSASVSPELAPLSASFRAGD